MSKYKHTDPAILLALEESLEKGDYNVVLELIRTLHPADQAKDRSPTYRWCKLFGRWRTFVLYHIVFPNQWPRAMAQGLWLDLPAL